MKPIISLTGLIVLLISGATPPEETVGRTVVTAWPGDKSSAISLTYDDGTIHQFTVARPIMNRLGFPATFYIITGKVAGSAPGKFIGRSPEEIIGETASVNTNADNFFERASLIAYTGMDDAVDYHSQAGTLFEAGKAEEAYAVIDDAYAQVRRGQVEGTDEINYHDNSVDTTTWEDFRAYGAEGHEIASHTVTHPRLAVLDEANLRYELEQSKADIRKFMGEEHTFSAECPYGTEDERVMEYAHPLYPALRNRMPVPYLDEINRASPRQPGASDREYVQWQRGPVTSVGMEEMKSWVDTCLAHRNIWLVLVFHGVDGIGWEPRTGAELEEYFGYLKEREDALWVATFADVTKYLRERKAAEVSSERQANAIVVQVSSTLDPAVYDVPLTLKTYVPESWEATTLERGGQEEPLGAHQDSLGSYVLYDVSPAEGELRLAEHRER